MGAASIGQKVAQRRRAVRKRVAGAVLGWAFVILVLVVAVCAVAAFSTERRLPTALHGVHQLGRRALVHFELRADPEDLASAARSAGKAITQAHAKPIQACRPRGLTMFRGNPQRNLSGIGPVPRRPKLLWRFQTHTKLEGPYEKRGSAKVTETTPWAGLGWTGQPVCLEGRLYFGSPDSYVYCLDFATGKPVWYYPNHHCIKGSIAIFNGLIYHGGRDNKIHCYDLKGRMVWETRTGNDMDSSPVVIGGLGYIGGEDNYVYCFDAHTGEIVWKYGPALSSFESSPCVVANSVIIGDGRGQLVCLDRQTGKLQWEFNTQGDTDHTPVYWKGRIYAGCATGDSNEQGHLWCITSGSGKLIWHAAFKRGFWATSALDPGRDRLYVGNNDGYFYALAMSTGKQVWRRDLHARIWGSAAVTDGHVVVGTRDGRVWCLDETTGKPLWVFDALFDIDATPCVAQGRIVIGDQGGWVYCIGEAAPGEAINGHWFVTRFPQQRRLDHNAKGIPTFVTPAPPPQLFMDTRSASRENYLRPVYGPGWKKPGSG